jgi:hypothetical protein
MREEGEWKKRERGICFLKIKTSIVFETNMKWMDSNANYSPQNKRKR